MRIPTAVAGVGAVVLGLVGSALHLVATEQLVHTSFWLMGAAAALAYGTTATVLAVRRAPGPVPALLAAVGLGQGLSLAAGEYASAGLTGTGLPADDLSLWVSTWVWAPPYVMIAAVLPLLLPDGLPSARWRPAAVLSWTAVVAVSMWWALLPYDEQDVPIDPAVATNPAGVESVATPLVGVVVGALGLTAAAVALVAMAVRWRRATGSERRALSWVLVGVVATAGLLAVSLSLPPGAVGETLAAVGMLPLPLGCAVAAVRHQLWDVDVVLSRSLLYASLSGAVVAAYVASVALLGGLVGDSAGAPVLATVVVALLVLPLHARLQRAVNRLVHGDAEDPFTALGRLGDRLEATADPTEVTTRVLPELVGEVVRLLRVPWAEVELADGGRVAAGSPEGSGPRLRAPLVYAGTEVGALVVGADEDLTGRERRLLDQLCRQAAVAVHALLLARDLHRSREAVVVAREEERRRLRRDLHDGMGPSLAALALQAETARDLVGEDPAAATTILDRLVPRLTDAVEEVRTLVHGLRPPALDELGLAGAVEELARRFDVPGAMVSVSAGGDLSPGALPAAVDVAAYRIVAEALANTARHSGARTVQVEMERGADRLDVRVRDDGRGLLPGARPGVGLTSMRQRAAELGGTLEIRAGNGTSGTVVHARLPLTSGGAA